MTVYKIQIFLAFLCFCTREVVSSVISMQLVVSVFCSLLLRLSVIHNKDLLATIHLLVAMVRCFQPELDLPLNVKVEVILVEVSLSSSFCSLKSVLNTPWGIAAQFRFALNFSSRQTKVESNQKYRRRSWQRKGGLHFDPVWFCGCEKNTAFTSYIYIYIFLASFNRDVGSDSLSNTESE